MLGNIPKLSEKRKGGVKTKVLMLFVILSFLVSGCASKPHVIGYDIIKTPLPTQSLGKIYILPFDDARPKEEHEGARGKLLAFHSKDVHFNKPVTAAIREILSKELNGVGFSVVEEKESPRYRISGSVKHFQAIMSPAKITFLTYLGSVSTLWAKDEFTIALSIYIEMTKDETEALIDKTFDVSEDMKLPTGLLSLARYSRGFNYKLKLLDEALKDVMGQIREEVLSQTKR